ncbi:MAG: hypothetical protein DMF76_27545 [Acidobacteria bacterium]|nr:MAG: hypothetical protein DMF76_27545 [Acidobacteriota bacterium]
MPKKKDPAAVKLGRKGGKEIAKRGPEYFRQLQARREKRKGGRPPSPRNPTKKSVRKQRRTTFSATLSVIRLAYQALSSESVRERPKWFILVQDGQGLKWISLSTAARSP